MNYLLKKMSPLKHITNDGTSAGWIRGLASQGMEPGNIIEINPKYANLGFGGSVRGHDLQLKRIPLASVRRMGYGGIGKSKRSVRRALPWSREW